MMLRTNFIQKVDQQWVCQELKLQKKEIKNGSTEDNNYWWSY